MAYQQIPGLTYQGKSVYYDDGVAATPNPTPAIFGTPDPVVVTNSNGSRTINIPMVWGPPGTGNIKVYTKDFGGFKDTDIIVVKFTTPLLVSDSIGNISVGEYQSNAISRTVSLNNKPAVFDNTLGGSGFFGQAAMASGNTTGVSFRIGSSKTDYPRLLPNTTYYFNIKNTSGVGGNLIIELIKPQGM
jgi:hypothetical protein